MNERYLDSKSNLEMNIKISVIWLSVVFQSVYVDVNTCNEIWQFLIIALSSIFKLLALLLLSICIRWKKVVFEKI